MIRDYQAIHQTWFERGKQRKVKTYGKLEKWMIFMKTAGDKKKKNMLEQVRKESEVIDMAVKKLEVLSQDEKQRQAYYAREKALLDEKSKLTYAKRREEIAIQKAVETAKKEARKEGIEEGIKEGEIRIVKNLLKLGMDLTTIKQSSGLSEEEINRLKEEIQKEQN